LVFLVVSTIMHTAAYTFSRTLAVGSIILTTAFTRANSKTCFAMAKVPDRMMMTPTMKDQDINSSKLLPLEISLKDQEVSVVEREPKMVSEILSEVGGEHGSIAFVVRRPG